MRWLRVSDTRCCCLQVKQLCPSIITTVYKKQVQGRTCTCKLPNHMPQAPHWTCARGNPAFPSATTPHGRLSTQPPHPTGTRCKPPPAIACMPPVSLQAAAPATTAPPADAHYQLPTPFEQPSATTPAAAPAQRAAMPHRLWPLPHRARAAAAQQAAAALHQRTLPSTAGLLPGVNTHTG